jgi:rhodanese-related sulfurtransferase
MDYSQALAAHSHVDPARTYLVCCEVEFKSADLAERLRAAGRRAHYFAGGTGKLLRWAASRDLVDPGSVAAAVRDHSS